MATSESRDWIRDLRPGREVNETYAVRSKESRQRRGGGSYLAVTLADRTGQVAALAWENVAQLARVCEVGSVVRVQGQVQRYNQRLQLVIRQAEVVDPAAVDDELYVRSSSIDPDLLWRRLMSFVDDVGDTHLRQLLYRVFSDPLVEASFLQAPAARTMHHAFRSGLLEHTVSMAGLVAPLAQHYGLHRDLAMAGVLLHDLGKIWELETTPTIEYTDDGRLLGHLLMGVVFVERKIGELATFPPETRRQLVHVLLSHHGEYQYGSPRRPKTPEALVVHLLDTLDSKLAGMMEAIAGEGESDEAWTPYSRILERPVYRRRLDSDEDQKS